MSSMSPSFPGFATLPERPGDVWWDTVEWMPDSSAVVFSLRAQIEIMTVADGERRILIEDGFGPVVSPDGSQIAYRACEAARDDITEIWVAAADGSDPRRVAVSSTPPAWSPDGSVVLAGDDEGWFTVRPDGTGRTEIAPFVPPGQLNHLLPGQSPQLAAGAACRSTPRPSPHRARQPSPARRRRACSTTSSPGR